MCATNDRIKLKEQFNKLIDDLGEAEKKIKKLEEFLNIEFVSGDFYQKKAFFKKRSNP